MLKTKTPKIATLQTKHSGEAVSSDWYIRAVEKLVGVMQDLSRAHDVESIMDIVRKAARELTGADGATFVLRDGDQCYYAEEDAISPLWKGNRFPLKACISGWVMLNAKPAIIEDIYVDPRIPADAYRPTFVKSLAMVPIRQDNPIGAIGNYWATKRRPTDEELAILQTLADTTSVALENARLYTELQKEVDTSKKQQAQIGQQHETLEIFTRALAHDLKEPMRTIHSLSAMIGRHIKLDGKPKEYFDHIHHAATRMGMLVESVFQYMQLGNPEINIKQNCDMEDVLLGVKENLTQLIAENGAIVTGDALPAIQAHPAQMLQLIQNLVANAIYHNARKTMIYVGAEEHKNHWLFYVHDNGRGITKTDMEKIFLPFKRLQSDDGHAGLGLSTCRKIVETHGGRIWCESAPGEGTKFYFTLPKPDAVTPVENWQDLARASVSQIESSHKKVANILVVDDRVADIEITQLTLRDRDRLECNMAIAHNGGEALQILQDAAKDGVSVDLVLLDINMPGMDGFDLLEMMYNDESLKNTAVVICSGSAYEKDIERAKSLGAAGYLVKPPSFEKLRPILDTIPSLHVQQAGEQYRLLKAG